MICANLTVIAVTFQKTIHKSSKKTVTFVKQLVFIFFLPEDEC